MVFQNVPMTLKQWKDFLLLLSVLLKESYFIITPVAFHFFVLLEWTLYWSLHNTFCRKSGTALITSVWMDFSLVFLSSVCGNCNCIFFKQTVKQSYVSFIYLLCLILWILSCWWLIVVWSSKLKKLTCLHVST